MCNSTHQNVLSDVDYLVNRARQYSKSDPYASKAWLITAKSLFPTSFVIQVRLGSTSMLSMLHIEDLVQINLMSSVEHHRVLFLDQFICNMHKLFAILSY